MYRSFKLGEMAFHPLEERTGHTKTAGDPFVEAQCPELSVTDIMAGFLTYPAFRRLPIAVRQ